MRGDTANIYLHEVLDSWFATEVQPRMRGRAFMVRYADDAVLVFSERSDAERVMEVLPKRFSRYGLSLHQEKARPLCFERPGGNGASGTAERPATFDFLGFTHMWGKSRKGRWAVTRKTSAVRFRRGIATMKAWMRRHRHLPVPVQQRVLNRALEGHYRYYGVTANFSSLSRFKYCVALIWHKWLSRRSQRRMTKKYFFENLLRRHPLPKPRCYASFYRQQPRLDANLHL